MWTGKKHKEFTMFACIEYTFSAVLNISFLNTRHYRIFYIGGTAKLHRMNDSYTVTSYNPDTPEWQGSVESVHDFFVFVCCMQSRINISREFENCYGEREKNYWCRERIERMDSIYLKPIFMDEWIQKEYCSVAFRFFCSLSLKKRPSYWIMKLRVSHTAMIILYCILLTCVLVGA